MIVIASDQSVVGNLLSEFPGFRFTHPSKATLLGSLLGMYAMAPILQSQIESLLTSADGVHSLILDLLTFLLLHTQSGIVSCWPGRTTYHPMHLFQSHQVSRRFGMDRRLMLSLKCNDDGNRAGLLGSRTPESGAWLNAPPVSSLGLRMDDTAICTAVGLRVGAPLGQLHQCTHCESEVEQFARHGLSCRHSQGRFSRHCALNNIIQHSLSAAGLPSQLEPSGPHRLDRKRPDGMSMTPWEQGKFLVWDAMYIDTFCQSNVRRAANEAGGTAAYAEEMKERKYSHLGNMYFFQPIAVETCGSIGPSSMAFLLFSESA